MLVLSRKKKEAVMIGDAELIILSISGTRVVLGVRAPSEVRIMRKEANKESDTDEDVSESV